MSGTSKGQLGYSIAGVIFMAIGLAVFAIRLVHAGPYALPGGAAFVGALLAIALVLICSGRANPGSRV